MTAKEVKKLQALLGGFFPTAPQMKNPTLWEAWRQALREASYETIKARAIDYALENKFFPDLADLTAGTRPAPQKEGWVEKYL